MSNHNGGASSGRANKKYNFKKRRHSGGGFGGGNRRSFGGGNRRGFGGGRGRGGGGRRMSFFDPSRLIQNTVAAPEQATTYVTQHKFTDFALDQKLEQNILDRGYEIPTPIQDQIIPHILEKKDVIGLASTGTGKTAAFLLPLIHNLLAKGINSRPNSGKILIMAPTRELAIQIEAEFKLFAKGLGIYSAICIGGANIKRQIQAIRRSPQFVIGTPGRLIDLEKRRVLNLASFDTIVLDEVDQMFDMGFVHDMKYVIAKLPKERHSLFFSATLPNKLDGITNSFLTNPIKVQLESQKASVNVDQGVVRIKGKSKVDLLHDLLIKKDFDKVLVFGRTKHGLNKLDKVLYERGFKVATIHGNKSQSQRQRALRAFKSDAVQILLATDIASRGLDIDNVTHVINYDLPQTREDYIHRIGRTGRANKTGIALSFVD